MSVKKDLKKAASILGKLGGSKKSDRKTKAARENGKKGGRPKKGAKCQAQILK